MEAEILGAQNQLAEVEIVDVKPAEQLQRTRGRSLVSEALQHDC
jgi:hypothetical protein